MTGGPCLCGDPWCTRCYPRSPADPVDPDEAYDIQQQALLDQGPPPTLVGRGPPGTVDDRLPDGAPNGAPQDLPAPGKGSPAG